jgi:hypothetical protein
MFSSVSNLILPSGSPPAGLSLRSSLSRSARFMLKIFLNFTRATGHPHPHLQTLVGNYTGLLRAMDRNGEEVGRVLSELSDRYGVALGESD